VRIVAFAFAVTTEAPAITNGWGFFLFLDLDGRHRQKRHFQIKPTQLPGAPVADRPLSDVARLR
jgi:hypothetical protein